MSEIFDNKFMYLTDPNTSRTKLIIFKSLDNNKIDKSKVDKRLVFFPEIFETMNNN